MKSQEYFRTQGRRDDGNNGFFIFPHYKISDYEIRCQVSDGLGWEHVSITIGAKNKNATRCPTWDEMCWVKDQFWDDTETIIQYHPPKSKYISCHPFCLHLWRPIDFEIPIPDTILVGPNSALKSQL